LKPPPLPLEVTPLTDGDLLNTYLADRDLPCPRCGYNLRLLVGRRCPECGDELTLQVGLVEPRMAAYLTTLGAACAGVGGSGLFCLIGLSAAPSNWWRTSGARMLLVLLVVSVAMLTATLLRRRRFRRAASRTQWRMAIGACLLIATMFVLVVALFKD
jgi:hypothetical protein